jgi:hypothetical protein
MGFAASSACPRVTARDLVGLRYQPQASGGAAGLERAQLVRERTTLLESAGAL